MVYYYYNDNGRDYDNERDKVAVLTWSRRLQPTPPTMRTSAELQCAIARSVISTSIANTVSWSEKHRSAFVAVPLFSMSLAAASTWLRMPENETSMPLTTYGNSTYLEPFFASCSILYPASPNPTPSEPGTHCLQV
jgi:hypothetical protein